MQSKPLIEYAWELHRAGKTSDEVACQIGKHRATVYRWFRGKLNEWASERSFVSMRVVARNARLIQ